MALTLQMIESILVHKTSESSLSSILLEYATVKQKFESTNRQSWYFRQAIESNKAKLLSLLENYESIRALFNKASVDSLILAIDKNNSKIASLEGGQMNGVLYMVCNSLRGKNEFYGELIRLKRRTDVLMPIDHYLQTPEALLGIID